MRRPEVRAATHPGSPVALRNVSTSGYTRISTPPGAVHPYRSAISFACRSAVASRVPSRSDCVVISATVSPGTPPPVPSRDPLRLPFRSREQGAVALRLRRHQRHRLAAHAPPGEAARRQPQHRAGIVELQNLAIAVPFHAHLVGAELAHPHAVPVPRSHKTQLRAVPRHTPQVAANGVEAEG